MKKSRFIIYIIILIISTINYSSDSQKFFFTGHSATYAVVMIKHHYVLTMSLAILVVLFSEYSNANKKKWAKYLYITFVFIWILSMRTYAVVYTKNTLVSGWSFIPISECELPSDDTLNNKERSGCTIKYDPFLRKKLEQELSKNSKP
ncbi:hypothetical protein [uncultured Microscilla sp.]|uniref:hypothetical protein n=1 Tax=uncultured Microscilla sp. TaxID=432653 RepID=UPI0026273040|nr:hypothetical protein [uncultured Microscilla sp.]